MKVWQIAAPVGIIAGAAAAIVLSKKSGDSKPAPKAKGAAAPAKKEALKNAKTGSYSFVSGFKDAATVEFSIKYDSEKFSFDVIGEEFLTYSSDSHVAVMYGPDIDLQIEYASFYQGDDFAALAKAAEEKYQDFAKVSFNGTDAIRYVTGDNVCLCLNAANDAYSYILVSIFKRKDDDKPLIEVLNNPDLAAALDTIEIKRS